MTLVDTNILIDATGPESQWRMPALRALDHAATRGKLYINSIIFAEFSIGYDDEVMTSAELDIFGVEMLPLSARSLHRAGQIFRTYRRAGGTRTGVLPDFFIGAQAEAEKLPLLTRDAGRYAAYFPADRLILPA